MASTENLDLVIINPAQSGVYQPAQERSGYPAFEPPYLGLLTAAVVREKGYSVEVIDANADGLSPESTAKRVAELKPQITHIIVHGNQPSASSQLMDWVNSVGTNLADGSHHSRVILSGTHPSALPERTLKESSGDLIVRGDGFNTLLDLLEGRRPSEIRGALYLQDGKLAFGPQDRLATSEELARLPMAAWDLVDVSKYRAHDWHCLDNLDARQPYAAIYTSFGCPFSCTFCCINAPFNNGGEERNTIRFRNPKKIVDELESLVQKGVRNVKIIDEMFVFNPRHYVAIANEIVKRGLGEKLNIWAYARVDTVKEGNLDLLKSAGFNWLGLGIESGSAHVRDGAEKSLDNSDIRNVVRSIQSHGINVVGNYIFGLPDDTLESMEQTMQLARDVKAERPNFYSAMAYPGSELHRMAQQQKLPLPPQWPQGRALLPEDSGGPGWIGYSQHGYKTWPLPTAHLMPEEVLAFRDKSLQYFLSNDYRSLVETKFGKPTANLFCEPNAQTPKRKILGD